MIYKSLRLYRVIIPRLSANPISADNQTEAEQAGHLQVTSFTVDARDHDHDAPLNDDDYDSTSKPCAAKERLFLERLTCHLPPASQQSLASLILGPDLRQFTSNRKFHLPPPTYTNFITSF